MTSSTLISPSGQGLSSTQKTVDYPLAPDRHRRIPGVVSKGDWIAFGHGLPQSDIWVTRPDGSEGHALTDSLEPEWLPAWSPSGEKIVFVRGFEGQTTLWIMNADGSGQRQLTRIHGDMSPAWAPHGSRLVFVRNGSLYLMDPSGEHVRSLQVEGVLPSWGKG